MCSAVNPLCAHGHTDRLTDRHTSVFVSQKRSQLYNYFCGNALTFNIGNLRTKVNISLYSTTVYRPGATPGRARSNDLAGRSTALPPALAPRCLALRIALRR